MTGTMLTPLNWMVLTLTFNVKKKSNGYFLFLYKFYLGFLLNMGIAAMQIYLSTFWREAVLMVLKVSNQSLHNFTLIIYIIN